MIFFSAGYYALYLDAAIIFLQKVIEEIGLKQKVIRTDVQRPILVATWIGKEPDLPTVLLNSHTDVVPGKQEKTISSY